MLVHPLILAVFATGSLQSINGQLTSSNSPTTCPKTECCEEDCCGPGTAWVAPNCVTSPGAPGYDGNYYSSEYESGCAFRECCDGACCGPSTMFNSDNFCVPSCPNDVDSSCPWTAWLDRDNPTVTGDWENLSAFASDGNPVCNGEVPLAIECQAFGTLSGGPSPITLPVDASATGEIIVCDTCRGLWCENKVQDDLVCNYDYRVRFKCPCVPTPAPSNAPTRSPSPTTSQSPTGEDTCTSSTVGDVYINSCEEKCECEETEPGQYETVCYREREEFTCMPLDRRQRFIDTYISAVATDPVMQALVDNHMFSPAHSTQNFLPWHRWYIMAIEDRLRIKNCSVTVPWWKWEKHSNDWQTSPPFFPPGASHWLGGDGAGPSQCVDMGPFASSWQPGGPVSTGLSCLRRSFSTNDMPSVAAVANVHEITLNPADPPQAKFSAFSNALDSAIHGPPHGRIGGTVGYLPTAAKAPEFFLHHAHIDQIWDHWQREKNPPTNYYYGFPFPGVNAPLPETAIPGSNTPRTVAYHLDLKKSGVAYVKEKTSTTPSPLSPQCCWSYTGGGDGGSGGGGDYYDQVYNLDEIEDAIYELAANGTLYDIPQRPTYVPTIEELKEGFFWTGSEGSNLTDGFREERLVEMREKIIVANAALQFPTMEFEEDTSRMLGIDVGAIIARFNICQLGSEWIPATGRCSAVNAENQTLIQAVLDNSVFFLGDIVRNEDVDLPPSTSSPSPSPLDLGSISGNVKGDDNNDDIGDANLVGVPILLLDNSGNLAATTVTDINGDYAFYDLPAGPYSVTETNIASYPLDVSDADGGDNNVISVRIGGATGANSTGNDFVDEPVRTVSGQVLVDTDNDDVGDEGLSGVVLTLFGDSGSTVGTTFTSSNGVYTFAVPPGMWTVVQTNVEGYIDVSDSDGGDPNTITVDSSVGDSPNNNFVCRLEGP